MNKTRKNRALLFVVCMVLVAATALFAPGCSDNKAENSAENTAVVAIVENGSTIGEGETAFSLTITDGEGNETKVTVRTDKETVGEALLDLGVIAGEEGEYGLYVKTVNGITADYDTEGTYWAFYINGEYAMSGVDSTNIEAGTEYALKVEK